MGASPRSHYDPRRSRLSLLLASSRTRLVLLLASAFLVLIIYNSFTVPVPAASGLNDHSSTSPGGSDASDGASTSTPSTPTVTPSDPPASRALPSSCTKDDSRRFAGVLVVDELALAATRNFYSASRTGRRDALTATGESVRTFLENKSVFGVVVLLVWNDEWGLAFPDGLDLRRFGLASEDGECVAFASSRSGYQAWQSALEFLNVKDPKTLVIGGPTTSLRQDTDLDAWDRQLLADTAGTTLAVRSSLVANVKREIYTGCYQVVPKCDKDDRVFVHGYHNQANANMLCDLVPDVFVADRDQLVEALQLLPSEDPFWECEGVADLPTSRFMRLNASLALLSPPWTTRAELSAVTIVSDEAFTYESVPSEFSAQDLWEQTEPCNQRTHQAEVYRQLLGMFRLFEEFRHLDCFLSMGTLLGALKLGPSAPMPWDATVDLLCVNRNPGWDTNATLCAYAEPYMSPSTGCIPKPAPPDKMPQPEYARKTHEEFVAFNEWCNSDLPEAAGHKCTYDHAQRTLRVFRLDDKQVVPETSVEIKQAEVELVKGTTLSRLHQPRTRAQVIDSVFPLHSMLVGRHWFPIAYDPVVQAASAFGEDLFTNFLDPHQTCATQWRPCLDADAKPYSIPVVT